MCVYVALPLPLFPQLATILPVLSFFGGHINLGGGCFLIHSIFCSRVMFLGLSASVSLLTILPPSAYLWVRLISTSRPHTGSSGWACKITLDFLSRGFRPGSLILRSGLLVRITSSLLSRCLLLSHHTGLQLVIVRYCLLMLKAEILCHTPKDVRSSVRSNNRHIYRVRCQLQELKLAHSVLLTFNRMVDALDDNLFVALERPRFGEHNHIIK